MIGNAPFFVVGVLFLMGLLGIFMTKNLIKIAIAVSILGSSVTFFSLHWGTGREERSRYTSSPVRGRPWSCPLPRR